VNPLHAHQALVAATERRAVSKTTRCHVHVSPRPLVVVGYHLAGDPGAPLALLWGDDRDGEPRCMVVPEPRDRALRFEALAEFATDFLRYLSRFEHRDHAGQCLDAPQLVVPNAATADWLGGVVGRFTRNLRTDDDARTPAGKHLSFFADPMPGSSLVLAATDALTLHWQTGQLTSEDLNLAALLGWIDPPAGMDGPQAARVGERTPPAGPESDPAWDDATLTGLVRDWHADGDAASRSAVRRDRWSSDRRRWTAHCDRIAEGRAFFRNIPTPIQDARRLRLAESLTEALEREMAWDDQLVMAALVAGGEALAGRVVAADLERRGQSANGRRVRRPLITIEPALEFPKPAGTTLFLSTRPSVSLNMLPSDGSGLVRAEVVTGANTSATVERLPGVGDEVVLSPYGEPEFYTRPTIRDIPWTHQRVIEDDTGASR
jgi:hypothetical protein